MHYKIQLAYFRFYVLSIYLQCTDFIKEKNSWGSSVKRCVQTFDWCCTFFEIDFNFCHHFADNEEIARDLEELYGDIDAVEFYPGLLVEQARPGAIFGESMVEMGAPFSLKGLFGNPICSPEYWKPSTFGGKVGFDLVNSATLKKLVCLNTKTCPYVAFRIPREERSHQSDNSKARTDEL